MAVISTMKNFNIYQKERFPIAFLALSFLPAILSSAAAVDVDMNLGILFSGLATALAYLLHIRIVDEIRDYEHDLTHHQNRPVPRGLISLSELKEIDVYATLLFMSLAAFAGIRSLLAAFVLLFYSYLAEKEFFLSMKLRRYFFTYNALNLMQMLLLQIFLYVLFLDGLVFTGIILLHFVFTSFGTLIFEFLRKVKLPGKDGTGKDTYTYFLGFSKALAVCAVLAIANASLFFMLLGALGNESWYWRIIALAFVVSVLFAFIFNWFKRSDRSNQTMQLSVASMYAVFNLIIYFSA